MIYYEKSIVGLCDYRINIVLLAVTCREVHLTATVKVRLVLAKVKELTGEATMPTSG